MLNEVGSENRSDGVKSAEESCRDSVKAHSRNGGSGAEPLFKARLIKQRTAETCKSARNNKGKNHVAFFRHTAVLSGVLVVTGCFQFVTELGFVKHNRNDNRNNNSKRNCNADIFVVIKELFKSKGRQKRISAMACNLVCIRTGRFFYIIKYHVRCVKAYPVEHDSGNNFVDVTIGFEHADKRTENSTSHNGENHAGQPAPVPRKCCVKSRAGACYILTGSADVK